MMIDVDAMDIDGSVDLEDEIEGDIIPDPVLYHAPIDAFQLMHFADAASRSESPLRGWMTRFFSKAQQTVKQWPLSLNEMLQYQSTPLPAPLLKESTDVNDLAVEMFGKILYFSGSNQPAPNTSLKIAQELLEMGLRSIGLKNELYVQLFKQSRANSDASSKLKTWMLFHLVTCTIPPSTEFNSLLIHHVQHVARDDQEHPNIKELASRTWTVMKTAVRSRPRKHAPTLEEISANISNQKLTTPVLFLDGTTERLYYDISTTVLDAVNQLASLIGLGYQNDFSLFESQENNDSERGWNHTVLYDQHHIADILIDFAEKSRDGKTRHLLFKKIIFRESDEYILESQFLNLSYLQAQYDYLMGNYPVGYEDASRLCAFQLFSEFGHNLPNNDTGLFRAIEKYTSVDVPLTGTKEEWKKKVMDRYHSVKFESREDARNAFLSLLKTLPYGMAIFFKVSRLEDPMGILPPSLLLGINKNGMHFFKSISKEYLFCIDFRDISHFGFSSKEIYFKMKVCGVLHAFRFESRQGEDVCMALKTYMCEIINDGRNDNGVQESGLADADFGRGYEEHLAKMQAAIRDAANKEEELKRLQNVFVSEITRTQERLDTLVKSTVQSQELRRRTEEELVAMGTEIRNLKAYLTALDKSFQKEPSGITIGPYGSELNTLLKTEADSRSLMEKCLEDKQMIEEKIAELETSKKTETGELKRAIENVTDSNRDVCAAKDKMIVSLVEKVANMTAMLNANSKDAERMKAEREELSQLRWFRIRVEEQERDRLTKIEGQKQWIDRLEGQYRVEQLERKKIFNRLQDLKGRIRVYARVRPILERETAQGHRQAVNIQDAFTISHAWRHDACPREYTFDGVLSPVATQADVFEKTQDLIQSAIDGYNVCIFAYGQTGSGKTHTIYGTEGHPGLAPRGIQTLFKVMADSADKCTFTVTCYMLELYRDALMDLLSDDQPKIPLKRRDSEILSRLPASPRVSGLPRMSDLPHASGRKRFSEMPVADDFNEMRKERGLDHMVRLSGITILKVHSAEELMEAFEKGQNRRHIAATEMNIASSRSHLIMSIVVEATDRQTLCQTSGKLTFVDLAGSERLKKSGSAGEQLKEAQAINKSLSALGDVISSLARGDAHVPYRNHKLTMLMSDSIGGNAKTLMFVNVSPTDVSLDETQNSLLYATRVRTIRNEAVKHSNKESMKMKQQMTLWKSFEATETKEGIQKMIDEFQ